MMTVNEVTYFTPKEVADQSMIVNRKNKGDYGFVLRLIKTGKIKAQTFNEDSQIAYYMIPESEITRYNNRFSM